MAIYQIMDDKLEAIAPTTFAAQGIKERDDLQRLLREQVEIIAPDTLVVSEEFGEWDDSRRRIDLLGIDKDANLVVIELKRTKDGGHMELQAVRYAAMISTLTFNRVVDIYAQFLNEIGRDDDPESAILEFLDWSEVVEEEFAQEVKIVLASAEFSKEITTAVIWLNDSGLDIKCIRLKPYKDGEKVYLDVQQVIPLPEAEEYQISIRNKSRKEKDSRKESRNLTKFNITIGDTFLEKLPKRRAIFQIVKYLCDEGVNPDEIDRLIPWRNNMFCEFEGKLDSIGFQATLIEHQKSKGKIPRPRRYFNDDDELIYANGKTYAFHKMWAGRTAKAMDILVKNYKDKGVAFMVNE